MHEAAQTYVTSPAAQAFESKLKMQSQHWQRHGCMNQVFVCVIQEGCDAWSPHLLKHMFE